MVEIELMPQKEVLNKMHGQLANMFDAFNKYFGLICDKLDNIDLGQNNIISLGKDLLAQLASPTTAANLMKQTAQVQEGLPAITKSSNDDWKNKPKPKGQVKSMIKGETAKALLLLFGENEIWTPKSTIHNDYSPAKDVEQQFLIDTWILKRNNITWE